MTTVPENSVENTLDIYISSEGILCEISDDNHKVLLRRDLNAEINTRTDIQTLDDFFSQPELKVISDDVNIFIEDADYHLIPSELFREVDVHKLFDAVYGKRENEVVKYNIIPKWNLHLAYLIPEKIIHFLKIRFPDVEPKHVVFDLLKTFIHRTEEAVYLNIRKNIIDLALVKDNKLQLLNSFDVKTDEDIVYFTINVYEQFHLNTESFKLNIKSDKANGKSAMELLKQYVFSAVYSQ